MTSTLAIQSSTNIFTQPYNPDKDSNVAAWQPCDSTICSNLPHKSMKEIEKLCKPKNFKDIQSHFLQNINKLKELINIYIDNEDTKKKYAAKINTFYDKVEDYEKKIFPKEMLPLLISDTCLQICRIVSTLEQHQSKSADSNNLSKTKHATPLFTQKDEEIVIMLTDIVDGIDACLPGVHTRIQSAYEKLETIRGRDQCSLPAQIARIKTQLLDNYTRAFMHQQSSLQKLYYTESMEIHYSNYFKNLVCEKLGLKPIEDIYLPKGVNKSIGEGVEEEFIAQISLEVNSFTIIDKLLEEWVNQLSNIFGVSITRLEESISAEDLTYGKIERLRDEFSTPIHRLFQNEEDSQLTFEDLVQADSDEIDSSYNLKGYKEKLHAFIARGFFGKEAVKTSSELPGKEGKNFRISTTDHSFFWVCDNNSLSNTGKYTILRLPHLKSINFSSLNKNTCSALFIQALEQTDKAEDIASFFSDNRVINALKQLPLAAQQIISNKLNNKIGNLTEEHKNKISTSVISHFKNLSAKLEQEDIAWLIGTPLLESVLVKLKDSNIAFSSTIVSSCSSLYIKDFSNKSIQKLFTPQECETLYDQAIELMQADFTAKLLQTGYLNKKIYSNKQRLELLEFFAEKGSEIGVKFLLKQEPITYPTKKQTAPLHLATKNGHTGCIKLLLADSNTQVNAQDQQGRTALHWAARNGHTNCIKLLLANSNTQVNAQDKKEQTALHLVAKNKGQSAIIEMLATTKGININQVDKHGATALHQAAYCGNSKNVETLLAQKDIDVRVMTTTDNNLSALHAAVLGNSLDCVRLLANHKTVDVNANNSTDATPLHTAIYQGNTEIIQYLVDHKDIDLNKIGTQNSTPLHFSVTSDNLTHIQLLFKNNINPIRVQEALLLAAAQGCSDQVLQYLLNQKGIDVNSGNCSEEGLAALHYAAKNGHSAVVQLLLNQKNIDVNKPDNKGRTALHIAAEGTTDSHTQCVALLLAQHNIDLQTCLSALEVAKKQNNRKSIKLLKTSIKALSPQNKESLTLKSRFKDAFKQLGFVAKSRGSYTLSQSEMTSPFNKKRSELPTTDLDHALNPEVGSKRMFKKPGLLRRFKKGTYIVTDASLDKKQQRIDSGKYFSKGVFHKISQDTSTVLQGQG